MHVVRMQKVTNDNDNEPDTMFPIGLAALEILNRVRAKMDLLALLEGEEEQRKEDGPGNNESTKQEEQKEKERLRYLEHRVRDLKEFERRARGK